MTRQCQYHADVCDLRSDEACEFLLTDPKFLEWYHASDSRQLVILGDMGSGKTVATAYLIDELIKRNKHQLPQPKICYYYCRDDETGRAVYIFSALLLSLLKQLPGLQKPFYEWYKEAQASGNLEPATDWKKLQEYLQKAVETLDRPLFIVIDGLDECDGLSRKSLLELLRDLGQRNPRLKTVLSSRPEEDIVKQLSGSLRIDVIPSMERDRIIVAHTVERELSRLSQEVKSLIIERLSRLAQGSAIWTKMTVELIKVGEFRAIRTAFPGYNILAPGAVQAL
jgi:Cdc6-like AAA superfamily ATPase